MAVCWECFIFESLVVNLSLSWAEFTYCSSLYHTSLCYGLNLATGRKSDEFGAYIRYFPYLQDYIPILYEKNGFIYFVQLYSILRWNSKYNICYYLITWADSHLFDIYLVILPILSVSKYSRMTIFQHITLNACLSSQCPANMWDYRDLIIQRVGDLEY